MTEAGLLSEGWLLPALGLINAVLLVLVLLVLLLRKPAAPSTAVLAAVVSAGLEKTERSLRQDIGDAARAGRQEGAQQLATFQQSLLAQGAETARTQNAQIDAFAQQLARMVTSD